MRDSVKCVQHAIRTLSSLIRCVYSMRTANRSVIVMKIGVRYARERYDTGSHELLEFCLVDGKLLCRHTQEINMSSRGTYCGPECRNGAREGMRFIQHH